MEGACLSEDEVAQARRAQVAAALGGAKGVSRGKMFGSVGLKVGKQVFAMEVKGKLVVKVSPERAEELRGKGLAKAFDPGHGRPMKQWVAVSPEARVDWLELASEALAFASPGRYVADRRVY